MEIAGLQQGVKITKRKLLCTDSLHLEIKLFILKIFFIKTVASILNHIIFIY